MRTLEHSFLGAIQFSISARVIRNNKSIHSFFFLSFTFLALYSLEEDWTDIVRNSHMLSEKARSQQTALWELVETEVAYIRTLKVIQDVSN